MADHNDELVRYKVADLLWDTYNKKAEKTLVKMLKDPATMVRVNACDSLSLSENYKILNKLKERADRDRTFFVKTYAIHAIGRIVHDTNHKKKKWICYLEEYLNNNPAVQTEIATLDSLILLGEKKYLDRLIEKLNSGNYRNRIKAANCLKDFCDEENKDKIISAMIKREEIEKWRGVKGSIKDIILEIEKQSSKVKEGE